MTTVVVVSGVAGSGKTTVGQLLAARLSWPYADADDFHPRSNVDTMAAGRPLTDRDRAPWLDAIGRWVDQRLAAGRSAVVSCSALRRAHRDRLRRGRPGVRLVFLDGGRELIRQRLLDRRGHFMPAALLDSQFADLERPGPKEPVLTVSAGAAPADIVDTIVRHLPVDFVDRS
jgi:gluconokinase